MTRLRDVLGGVGRSIARSKRLIALVAAVSLALVASLVYAHSGRDVITACVKNANGKPRFVASKKPCRSGERRVVWNKRGEKGDKGDRGPQGPRGESVQVVVRTRTCAAIQAAINGLPPEGGIVLVAAGTYACRAPVVINRDHVTLRGTGPGTLLRLGDHVNRPVLVVGGTASVPAKRRDIHVADLAIDGNRVNQDFECSTGPCTDIDYLRNNAISLRRVDDVLIEHVTADNARSGGVVVDGSRRVTIRELTAADNELDGLAGYETRDSVFSGLFLHANEAAGLSLDNDFDHNTVDDAMIVDSGDVGVFMRDVHRNVFTALHVVDSASHGLFLAQRDGPLDTATDSPRRNTFTSLMVFGSGGAGIRVNDTSCADNLLVAIQLGDNDGPDIDNVDAAGDCLELPTPPILD